VKKVGAAIKAAGSDPNKQFGAIISASQGVDQAKLTQAEQNIDKFGRDKCGVDFSLSSGSDSSTASSSSSNPIGSFGTDSSFSFDESSFSSVLSSFSSDFGSGFFSS
jgi:hypothetical protein